MTENNEKKPGLTETVVRICPACGVVNPSGPSDGCPHIQLVRFDGVDGELENLIGEVARARGEYLELVSRLKDVVIEESRSGAALVETPHKARSDEVESLYPSEKDEGSLHLTHPRARKKKDNARAEKPRRRKRAGAPTVDPRQLELIANSPPKGDA